MKSKNGMIMSDRGSVRFTEGVFYDSNFEELFTPLTSLDFNTFINRVDEYEFEENGRLSEDLLWDIVDDAIAGFPGDEYY